MFIAALFIIARTRKQLRCPSTDEWMRKLWYIYRMEYYSAIKKNTLESVLMRWIKLEPFIQSEVSQKEKHQYSISSVQFHRSVMSNTLQAPEPQYARPPCPSSTPRVHPNPCPLCLWCHPTISSSVIPFFSHPQSFPASGPFQMSQLFASGGQSIGISASVSVLPMNIQDSFPLRWTGWICLQSKGLSRIFSNTTVQKHQFFSDQLSL